MKLTINHNGFHGYTRVTLLVKGLPGSRVELTPSQIKRLERAGCGMRDCSCGESVLGALGWRTGLSDGEDPFLEIPEGSKEINVVGHYLQN